MIRLLSICLALTVLCLPLCACSDTPSATVITKSQVNRPTQTITTTSQTTATTGNAVSSGNTVSGQSTTGSTGTTTRPSIGTNEGNSKTGDAIATTAISLIGKPFQVGGAGPDAFDNPSFVKYCYKQNGHTVDGRNALQIAEYGLDVNPEEIQPGDILAFCNDLGGAIGFVGIYIGNNQFVASTNPETGVKVLELNSDYWAQRFITARRFQ